MKKIMFNDKYGLTAVVPRGLRHRRDREMNAITRQEFDLWQRLMTTGDPYAFEVTTGDEVRRYLRYFFNTKRNENEHRTD